MYQCIWHNLGMAIVAGLVVAGTALVALLVWRNGHITRKKTEGWAASRGLTLTPETRVTVTAYLHTSGLLRGLGVLAGLILPVLWSRALGLGQVVVPPWTWAFLGYLVGALYAEVSLRRPRGNRAATSPRRLHDYLRPLLLRGQVVLGVLLVVVAGAVSLVPDRNDPFGRSPLSLVAALVAGLVGTPVLVMVERWLVLRPQPILSAAQLAADDAIRSQSVQSIAASGMAMQLTLLALPVFALSTGDVGWLRPLAPVGLVPVWLAVLVCFNFGHVGWRVHRRPPGPLVEATPC
jgi:hypothetical protein